MLRLKIIGSEVTMADILEIVQLGHGALRQAAEPVEDIHHPRLQKLIDNLIATAKKANGVGVAAPQVAQSIRLLIVASRPTLRYPHAPTLEPIAMINPVLKSHTSEQEKDWEGCLSVPGIRGLVPRYQGIEIEYSDRWGNLQHQQFEGFVARIFQHEFDHLQGIVFIDRVESTHELITEQEYQKRITDK
jgi:peptide deformylase